MTDNEILQIKGVLPNEKDNKFYKRTRRLYFDCYCGYCFLRIFSYSFFRCYGALYVGYSNKQPYGFMLKGVMPNEM